MPDEERSFFIWIQSHSKVLKEVIDILHIAGPARNWEALAIELGYSVTQLKLFALETSPPTAMLDDWIHTPEATLKKLCQALEEIKQLTVIDILNKYE